MIDFINESLTRSGFEPCWEIEVVNMIRMRQEADVRSGPSPERLPAAMTAHTSITPLKI